MIDVEEVVPVIMTNEAVEQLTQAVRNILQDIDTKLSSLDSSFFNFNIYINIYPPYTNATRSLKRLSFLIALVSFFPYARITEIRFRGFIP